MSGCMLQQNRKLPAKPTQTPVGEGLRALPPQRKCIKLETQQKCGAQPKASLVKGRGTTEGGGGIPATVVHKIRNAPKMWRTTQSLPCQREGDRPKAGGGIPQRRSAASETHHNCGVKPHSRSSRNADPASTAGGRRDPPLQKRWVVAGDLYYCCYKEDI